MFEISIKLSNEEKKLIKKSISYDENIKMSTSDPVLKKLMQEARKEFNDEIIDAYLTARMQWQD